MSWDYERDFVKVPRGIVKLLERDPIAMTVYLLVLSRARWEEGPSLAGRDLAHLQPGQAVIGQDEIAQLTATSRMRVRTALASLQKAGVLAINSTKRGTVVSVIGYTTSAASPVAAQPTESHPNNHQKANRQPTDNQQLATNEDLRSEKGDLRRPEHARARDPSTPVQAPVPVRSPELNPERSRLHALALRRLNEARLDVGGRVKQSLRPLHPFDNKLRDAVSFLLADEIIERFEADLEHVLQIRIAEALANPQKNLRWLSSSLFEWGAWRVALGMTLADVHGEHGPRELAFEPVREEDDLPDFTYGCIGGSQ